jgi:hypothetical protein
MNRHMDPLGDPLATRPMRMGWEFTIEQYPDWWFGFIDITGRQFVNSSILTRTQTRHDGPELLLTLVVLRIKFISLAYGLSWAVA